MARRFERHRIDRAPSAAVRKPGLHRQIAGALPYAGDVGPKASAIYQNVHVLGEVNASEFARLMVNMTTWVAPDQGCAACHNLADFSDDSLYTKVVARRMLQMVRHINAD